MLSLVKSLIASDAPKDRFDNLEEAAAEIESGCTVTFGPMPQDALGNKQAMLGDVTTYRFGTDDYLSYMLLVEGEKPMQLIVAESEGERYLAISREIDEDGQDRLFGAQSLDAVIEKPSIHQLRCRENVDGFKGWTVPSYRKQVEIADGKLVRGDVRSSPTAPESASFSYCLLTSPGHDYAIELEKYGDGTLKVYATIYRHTQDIVHVAVPLKARAQRKNNKARPWLSETGGMDALIETIRQNRTRVPKLAQGPAEILAHPAAYRMDHAVPQDALLECDVRVAVRVIEEALLNKMPISEVVRRVLGLPVVFREKIFFSMPLSELDYQALAVRYGLSADDKVAIRYRIVRELAQFAGEE